MPTTADTAVLLWGRPNGQLYSLATSLNEIYALRFVRDDDLVVPTGRGPVVCPCFTCSDDVRQLFYVLVGNPIFGGGLAKIGALFAMKGIKQVTKQMDYREVGCSPLLGSAKPVFKAHGSSDALAFKNAIRQAKEFVENDVNSKIAAALAEVSAKTKEAAGND